MGLLDSLTAPLRSLLGTTEDMERDAHTLLSDTGELEHQLQDAVASIHRASESMEHHVAAVDTLAASVPALTDSVNALVKELNGLLAALAPMAEAERDVSRLGHLFGRRHPTDPEAPAAPASPQAPGPSQGPPNP
ncbi:MAG: hypothetical protein JO321_03675 [Solirubrobacterales bacterium]|nr:hypothetical protein [Solirubrobacterales bacterium]MBV9167844.1 hypothetical protein [Solirubrobacterales bacterium]MBV9534495.1 hypothetical protein [Solirubrobacterales bacterium]